MSAWRAVALFASLLALAGCERAMHDMYEQPRLKSGDHSALFADGRADRDPPTGTVPRAAGEAADTSAGRRGLLPLAFVPPEPPRTAALLQRGKQRFEIACAACHGYSGDGDGMVVQRGFPAPPSLHGARLRAASGRYVYEVIEHGHGVMYPYADRVAPADRWAVVAYVRALQLARQVPAQRLSEADRLQLARKR